MLLVLLDGYTLNPGDLSWAALEALGPCAIYDRSRPEEVVSRAQDADMLLINKVAMTAAVIDQLPRLRYIGLLATGYNCVDLEAARRRGIVVTNVPAYGTSAVSQMVFAHLLNMTNRVADHAHGAAAGRWSTAPDWCYWDQPQWELAGRTLGVVGLGRIGRATAAIGRALGMQVIACNDPPLAAEEGFEMVDMDTLFRRSDVVSLHCPLTPQTDRLVNRQRLELMKPTALLINTSRGGLVDEAALAAALNAGRIAGAGLDVLQTEPPPADHPLLHARNCWITPHIAWATQSARQRLLSIVVDNVRAFLAGHPQNVVS